MLICAACTKQEGLMAELRAIIREKDAALAKMRDALLMAQAFIGPIGATPDPEDDGLRRIIAEAISSTPDQALADVVEKAKASGLEEAAEEALKPRAMLLTHAQVADGILSDDHPTLRIRKQMREEIAEALRERAAAIRQRG